MGKKTREVNIRFDEKTYREYDTMAADHGCSFAEAVRMAGKELGYQSYGDLDRDKIINGEIPKSDLDAFKRGEKDLDDFPDEYRQADIDEPLQVATPDGGAKPTPNSYSATYGPQDVRRSGPVLSWDELKDIIKTHWADTLEIHPDRVPFAPSRDAVEHGDPNRLKQVNSVTPKVLAAVCRSVAENDVVPGPVLDEMIEDYLSHLNRRDDREAGREYLREKYRERVSKFLYEHPDPGKDVYYTTEEKLSKIVSDELHEPLANDIWEEQMFRASEWAHERGIDGTPEETYDAWYENLGRFVDRLAMLYRLSTDLQYKRFTEEVEIDLSEKKYRDPVHYAVVLWRTLLDDYTTKVPEEKRELVESDYASPDAMSVLEEVL
jgi:hypothetical protein